MMKSIKFEMQIMNVFRLSTGRTVFAGTISGHSELIASCQCELQVDGRLRERFECEGEQIVRKHTKNDLRAIATVADVMLTSEEAQSGKCKLLFLEAS